MEFFLGTHEPSWLARTHVPLFVSRRRLARLQSWPRALGRWAYDSGGFTELQMFGCWSIGARAFADETRRYRDAIGGMAWAAPQDWMCEPIVIRGGVVGGLTFAGTGLSVPEHQRRTTGNFLELRSIAPEIPWAPVLQGWEVDDYLAHAEQYRALGVDLAREPIVGVGSVCRRQATAEAVAIFAALRARGLRLHGFGLKLGGLRRCSAYLASSDSLAWSRRARSDAPLAGCSHRSCANCLRYALAWRLRVLEAAGRKCQSVFPW